MILFVLFTENQAMLSREHPHAFDTRPPARLVYLSAAASQTAMPGRARRPDAGILAKRNVHFSSSEINGLQRANRKSLFRRQRFPVPCRAGNLRQRIGVAAQIDARSARKAAKRPEFSKFPVIFPVSREFGREKSSRWTASTATQSSLT